MYFCFKQKKIWKKLHFYGKFYFFPRTSANGNHSYKIHIWHDLFLYTWIVRSSIRIYLRVQNEWNQHGLHMPSNSKFRTWCKVKVIIIFYIKLIKEFPYFTRSTILDNRYSMLYFKRFQIREKDTIVEYVVVYVVVILLNTRGKR